MLKWIVAGLVVILLIAGLGWMNWRNSPMREMERSSAAVDSAKSWHYHSVRTPPGLPPDTFDKDTFALRFNTRFGVERTATAFPSFLRQSFTLGVRTAWWRVGGSLAAAAKRT